MHLGENNHVLAGDGMSIVELPAEKQHFFANISNSSKESQVGRGITRPKKTRA